MRPRILSLGRAGRGTQHPSDFLGRRLVDASLSSVPFGQCGAASALIAWLRYASRRLSAEFEAADPLPVFDAVSDRKPRAVA